MGEVRGVFWRVLVGRGVAVALVVYADSFVLREMEEEVTNPLLLRKHKRSLDSSTLQCVLFNFKRSLAANVCTKADS